MNDTGHLATPSEPDPPQNPARTHERSTRPGSSDLGAHTVHTHPDSSQVRAEPLDSTTTGDKQAAIAEAMLGAPQLGRPLRNDDGSVEWHLPSPVSPTKLIFVGIAPAWWAWQVGESRGDSVDLMTAMIEIREAMAIELPRLSALRRFGDLR